MSHALVHCQFGQFFGESPYASFRPNGARFASRGLQYQNGDYCEGSSTLQKSSEPRSMFPVSHALCRTQNIPIRKNVSRALWDSLGEPKMVQEAIKTRGAVLAVLAITSLNWTLQANSTRATRRNGANSYDTKIVSNEIPIQDGPESCDWSLRAAYFSE
jgi:hypothetical protein